MEFGWIQMTTVAGAAAVAVLIVQAIKAIAGTEIKSLWLRLSTFVLCTALLLIANAAIYGLTWESAGLCIINGVVAYLVATGAYKTVTKG
jgi:predicted membrane channel-forming protein YqfA (hemolysin III family)